MSSGGVLMAVSSAGVNAKPSAIRIRHSTPLAIKVVFTAVRRSPYSLAPKSRDSTTLHPTLHPKAKAR